MRDYPPPVNSSEFLVLDSMHRCVRDIVFFSRLQLNIIILQLLVKERSYMPKISLLVNTFINLSFIFHVLRRESCFTQNTTRLKS